MTRNSTSEIKGVLDLAQKVDSMERGVWNYINNLAHKLDVIVEEETTTFNLVNGLIQEMKAIECLQSQKQNQVEVELASMTVLRHLQTLKCKPRALCQTLFNLVLLVQNMSST